MQKNNSLVGASAVVALLGALIFYANRGEIAARHFFTADDWYWLYLSAFQPLDKMLGGVPLPQVIYNDRPVGALAIKLLYSVFGLEMKSFQWAQMAIHAANCVLLYLIGARYVGRPAAVAAAALAGTWIVADNAVFWTAAMFDLLGAFFCLLAIRLWQSSSTGRPLAWLALATVAYYLAVRTKEFAIGLPVLVFFMGYFLERRNVRQLAKELSGFVLVMVTVLAAYALILYQSTTRVVGAADNTYGLHILDIPKNLWHYVTVALYAEYFGQWVPYAALGLLAAAAIASPAARRTIGVSLVGFAVLLGPTLMLTTHRDNLYLYAPHFFLALAVATLLSLGFLWKVAGVAMAAALIVAPPGTDMYKNHLGFYRQRTGAIQEQFAAFTSLMGDLPRGSTVYIAGLEEYHNPFSYRSGDSVRIQRHDETLRFVIEKPEAQLKKEFCAAPAPKFFVTFNGPKATNDTAAVTQACTQEPAVPGEAPRP